MDRPSRWRLGVLIALGVLSFCTDAPAATNPGRNRPAPAALLTDAERARAFADRLEALRKEHVIPGLAVTILRGKETILAGGLGFADVENQVRVTPHTPFDIASVTKPLAAVVALRMREKGVLDLNMPMSQVEGFEQFATEARAEGGIFFKDFAAGPTPLTLRHLLSMSANGDPGSRFFYNPVAYSWASRPMAQAAKKPFSSLMEELVFQPAGMKRSARIHRYLPLPENLAADLAKPYRKGEQGNMERNTTPRQPQGDGAAGGVISTAHDLAAFDRALMEDKLIGPASRNLMWTRAISSNGGTLPYGLGWFIQEVQGAKLVWHTGLWEDKYSALYLKIPAQNLTLILLANSDGLRWKQDLGEVAIERSDFVMAFLKVFSR